MKLATVSISTIISHKEGNFIVNDTITPSTQVKTQHLLSSIFQLLTTKYKHQLTNNVSLPLY